MNHEHAMNGWTKAGMATILLAILLPGSGCALVGEPVAAANRFAGTPLDFGSVLVGKPTVASASTLSYVPYRAATEPSVPTPYQAEARYFGYHATSWRSWPPGWSECPGCEPAGEPLEVLPAPAPVPATADPATPLPTSMSWP